MENKSRKSTYPMISVDDALSLVLKYCEPPPPVTVDIEQDPAAAVGRVLAEDIYAADPLPPFRASVMDGYAVFSSDGVGNFPVVSNITAGADPNLSINSGEVAYITTGAPVPNGADAVVKVEETADASDESGTRVYISLVSEPGQWIREVGSDVAENQLVLSRGDTLSSAEIGLLATVGSTKVPLYPQPVVGVLSTGDELVPPSSSLAPGKIRDSNRLMLMAAVAEAQGASRDLGIAADTEGSLDAVFMRALQEVDILVTSGGVSMGNLDLVKPLLERLGDVKFGRLCMKPGITSHAMQRARIHCPFFDLES